MRLGALLPLLLAACATSPSGSEPGSPSIATVEAFRAAREAGDVEALRALLTDDPRIWYDERDGEGEPWRPWEAGSGRWAAWDEHFRGRSERVTDWSVEGDAVRADMFETNDYFELTERGGARWRATYFLAPDGRIAGLLVSSVPGVETPEGRGDEFEAWARAHHPEEAEYLMPGGSIDPTGGRPPRMRALLQTWRAAVGLEPIR